MDDGDGEPRPLHRDINPDEWQESAELVVNNDAIGRYRQLIQIPVGTAAES
ncbi:MAG: hypothetical protein JO272_09110 [Pseudonocardiales bacterium]|nr:hypothetical protein [Pseudonocardiales bacterium]